MTVTTVKNTYTLTVIEGQHVCTATTNTDFSPFVVGKRCSLPKAGDRMVIEVSDEECILTSTVIGVGD